MKQHYTRLQKFIRRALAAAIRIERYYEQHPEARALLYSQIQMNQII